METNMSTEKSFTTTTTIGRDCFIDHIEELEDHVASQVGQAMHYLANNRTRDARLHIEMIMPLIYKAHDTWREEWFAP